MNPNYPDPRDLTEDPTVKGCPNCGRLVKTPDCLDHYLVDLPAPTGRCPEHPAYDRDYCPACSERFTEEGTPEHAAAYGEEEYDDGTGPNPTRPCTYKGNVFVCALPGGHSAACQPLDKTRDNRPRVWTPDGAVLVAGPWVHPGEAVAPVLRSVVWSEADKPLRRRNSIDLSFARCRTGLDDNTAARRILAIAHLRGQDDASLVTIHAMEEM